ncbi:DNA polymerase [Neorhizobium sp. R1-B]|jgi:uracil-DNA glycosylase family protein|uniref:UdgX family uracil-DNA binding protein n=1 Tax=Neorhizobium TaxID=1525371 RepID=UPI000CF8CFA4|nr:MULTISPECIES: UdgX family uracil-DNA binding protein [Neorhizobium]TCV73537.1 DNA polymerase [Neorhizobium sp. S3-V5DH]TDX85727.1 DNA polymerase [Neorhizobium sp. R1-B]
MLTSRKGPAFETTGADGDHISDVRNDAENCTRCDLYKNATHLVFGEGPGRARILFVGEQPGDREDLAGKPFVGPAGRLLDRCLDEAGVDRDLCYVTNAVKHFKFAARGKRRIHAKPNAGEVQACAWWLAAELRLVKPKLAVALGATALYSLLGRQAKVTRDRGTVLRSPDGLPVLVTIHPSALLRTMDQPDAEMNRARFVEDLRKIADFVE